MRTLEEYNGKHKDKTCFVIGAGPSISDLNLELLRDHVTIAVNSGYVAVPWADFFISDDWSIVHWNYVFKDLRESKTTVALLYDNKLANCAPWFGDRSVLFRHRKGISVPDKYSHTDKKYFIGETRTSVGSAIMVAHIMGCSNIVLLGIDCCRQSGLRYFWQMPSFQGDRPFRNDRVPVDNYAKCKIAGEVTDYDLVDIFRTWNSLGSAINKKCKVYNASRISKLSIFQRITLEECLKF